MVKVTVRTDIITKGLRIFFPSNKCLAYLSCTPEIGR